jgi:hypothetical protein
MSPSKPKTQVPASRSGKTMQFEPVPPGVYEALETEAWFRRIMDEQGRWGRRKKKVGAEGSRGKDVVFEEALKWFLAYFEKAPPEHFDSVKQSWRRTAFWLSDDVLDRCRALASRAGVNKRQLIATALNLYCERLVPEELVKFRHRTFDEGREMYQRHRAAIRAALRRRKVP